jgi:hypothetical protein
MMQTQTPPAEVLLRVPNGDIIQEIDFKVLIGV